MMTEKRKYFDRKYERLIADAFVRFYNNGNDEYEFVCRPDEKYRGCAPLPDFEYCCPQNSQRVLIELKRILSEQATPCMSLYRNFLSLCDKFKNRIPGVFYILMRFEEIPQAQTQKSKERKKFFENIEEKLWEQCKKLKVKDYCGIASGVVLYKENSDNSDMYVFGGTLSPPQIRCTSYMRELLKNVGNKFINFNKPLQKSLDKNILLFLDKGVQHTMRNDIISQITEIELISKAESCILPVFNGLYEIYLISFDVHFNNDLTISRCYPTLYETKLCAKSQIFENATEYYKFLDSYFPG